MIRHVAFIVILLGVFYFLTRESVASGPYIYDEADYMYAVSLGFVANYTDSPTMPLTEFVNIGLSRGKDPGQRTEISELIRDQNDIVFYRHWHGPPYADWLHLIKHFAWDEHSMRAWSYVFPIVTALLMYFGALWLLPRGAGETASILAAALFLWSFPVANTTELAPHELFALCVVAALLLLGKLMLLAHASADPPALIPQVRRYWYAAVVATACAFCVLEVAFALVATLLIVGHAVRDRLKPDIAFVANSIGAFAGTVLLIWPGAILKLSFVKGYLFMAYLAIFRKGAWGSDISLAGTWWLRFVNSPVPWILLALAIFMLISMRRETRPAVTIPFLIYAGSIFLAIFRVNSDIPRYVLPLFPAVILIVAFTLGLHLARFGPGIRYGTVGLICAATLLTTFPRVRERRPHPDPMMAALLSLVRTEDLSHKRVLAPQNVLPMVHYYFPQTHLKGYIEESAIPAELRKDSFDGVVYLGAPPRYVSSAAVH